MDNMAQSLSPMRRDKKDTVSNTPKVMRPYNGRLVDDAASQDPAAQQAADTDRTYQTISIMDARKTSRNYNGKYLNTEGNLD